MTKNQAANLLHVSAIFRLFQLRQNLSALETQVMNTLVLAIDSIKGLGKGGLL